MLHKLKKISSQHKNSITINSIIVEEVDGEDVIEVALKIINGDKLLIIGLIWPNNTFKIWMVMKNKKKLKNLHAGASVKKDLSGLKLELFSLVNPLMFSKVNQAKLSLLQLKYKIKLNGLGREVALSVSKIEMLKASLL